MHFLGHKDIVSILTKLSDAELQRLLNTLHDVLIEYSKTKNLPEDQSKIRQPLRQTFTTVNGNSSVFMPSSLTTVTGIKVVNFAKGSTLPVGSINIFEPTGELRGVLDAVEITAFRTALATMILYSRFERTGQHVVLFGAGKQAEWHIRLALQLQSGNVSSVTVINRRSRPSTQELFVELSQVHKNVDFQMLNTGETSDEDALRQHLEKSDAIFCCTPATTPLFKFADLGDDKKSRFIGMIGSYLPHMQEIDKQTLLSGDKVYVDSISACQKEAGEIIMGEVSDDRLVEVGEYSREDKLEMDKNVIFKCVGLGIMDMAVSPVLLEMAVDKGLGTRIET